MTTTAQPSATADREIVISRIFSAPRALVFDAMLDPDNIGAWWGPNGFKTTTKSMDPRPDGRWVYTMHGPDGTDYPNWIHYREIVRPERLVYDHGGEVTDGEVKFHVTITLDEHPIGTALTMRSLFPSREARDLVVKKYGAVEGGIQHLGRLAGYVATKSPDAADRELATSRRMPFPREKIWAAMTDPVSLNTWWGPDGFTNTATVCDIRVGGDWRFTMHAPNGDNYPSHCRFGDLIKPYRWVIEHLQTMHYFQLEIVLTSKGDAETEVHWRQTFAKKEVCAAIRHICVPCNEQNLDRLAAEVAKRS